MGSRSTDAHSIHTDHSMESSESDILFFPTSSSARNSVDVAPEKASSDTVRASPNSYTPSHLRKQDTSQAEQEAANAESIPFTSNDRSGSSTTYRDDVGPSLSRRASLNPRTYWKMAEQASHAPSTRSLEHQQGGTLEERQQAYWKAGLVNVLLILCWYAFSTAISVYNKWMFDKTKHNFSFPLFVTSWHMMMQFGLSSMTLKVFPQYVPRRANGTASRPSASNWVTKVVPCALATAFDIGLSNTSLKTITLTFYTMCKSSNLAFVLFFAFLFGLEVMRWSLVGIIALITAGVVMMVAAETKFVLVGAVQVLTASALGGLRWALTQILLDRDEMGMSNPVATVFWLAPVMGFSLLTLSLVFESWGTIFAAKSGYFDSLPHALRTIGLMAGPGFLAFGMNLAEFALIKRTSVVTLSVAGIFKEVLTIALASSVFGDELTPINVTGLCITLLGIGLYNFLKYRLITRGGDSVGQEISGLNELRESIRSRASSIFHNGSGPVNGTRGNGYEHLDGAGDDESSLLFDERQERVKGRRMTGESDALELDTQRVSQEIVGKRYVSEEERERLRKIEEEADLSGWGTSGERITGQGLVEDHHLPFK